MKERPILFSAPMVRAILEGRKTQTRRVAKLHNLGGAGNPEPYRNAQGNVVWGMRAGTVLEHQNVHCPYGQPGDRLWVRETWAKTRIAQCPGLGEIFVYGACDNRTDYGGPWKPSIHMPRIASRILLEVVSVRVERLQSITAADVIAEGVQFDQHYPMENRCLTPCDEARAFNAFYDLWCSINGLESWDANPWVWVVEFRRIDQ